MLYIWCKMGLCIDIINRLWKDSHEMGSVVVTDLEHGSFYCSFPTLEVSVQDTLISLASVYLCLFSIKQIHRFINMGLPRFFKVSDSNRPPVSFLHLPSWGLRGAVQCSVHGKPCLSLSRLGVLSF